MIRLGNIHPLDHFKRNTAQFRDRLKKTGQPEVLTVDGKAAMVVQDAEAFEKMLDRLEHLETMESLRQSHADFEAGRSHPADEVHAELRREMGLPRRKPKQSRRSA
jgi:PHD/YefM family antitoxin component YafN of YafNO toxin-antitoxin module